MRNGVFLSIGKIAEGVYHGVLLALFLGDNTLTYLKERVGEYRQRRKEERIGAERIDEIARKNEAKYEATKDEPPRPGAQRDC